MLNVLAAIILLSSSQALANFCQDSLAHLSAPIDSNDRLINYLTLLLDQRAITLDDLAQLRQWNNPIPEDRTQTDSKAQVHRDQVDQHMNAHGINKQKILEWLQTFSKEKQRVIAARSDVSQKTKLARHEPEFVPIPAGEYHLWGEPTVIFHMSAFEILSTPVTQKQWVELMRKNPSYFDGTKGTKHLTTIGIDGYFVNMQPYHPVEQVTWLSAVVYANRLSRKAGLKEVYDLSGLQFRPGTSAEYGTLLADGEIKITAPENNIYLTEGYRLPTEREFDYLIHLFAKSVGDVNLRDYAWDERNSGETQPVALREPMLIHGQEVFDLVGNVSEWTTEWRSNHERVLRGGSFKNDAEAGLLMRFNGRADARGEDKGFRLVRSLK